MKRLVFGFLWVGIFIFLLLVMDQILLRYRGFEHPFMRDMQKFHADFRQRLFDLPSQQFPQTAPRKQGQITPAEDKKAPAINLLVEREIERAAQKNGAYATATPIDAELRYIYVDAQQNIQFAQRLEEIPAELRRSARQVTQ